MILRATDSLAARFRVWHVPSCSLLKYVIWVDDEVMRWAEVDLEASQRLGVSINKEHQARLIQIIGPPTYLVLIDPVEDNDNFILELAHSILEQAIK